MHDLIGRHFRLDKRAYAITDVRNIGAEIMVYAEPEDEQTNAGRAAFRYVDVEPLLEPIAAAS